MSAFGNLGLAGAVLCLLGLLKIAVFSRAPGGDAGVGHAWVIFMLSIALVVCFAWVTAVVGLMGGFRPFGGSTAARTAAGAGWLAMAVLAAYLYGDPGTHLPRVLRLAGMFVLPACLLAWGAVHLNEGLARALPGGAPRLLTMVVFALSCLPLAGKLLGGALVTVGHVASSITARGELDSVQQGIVATIDATDVQRGISGLLVHTTAGRHPIVRAKALAKIKSRADWQQELVRLLNTPAGPDVLGFLSANDVDQPALFPAAVHQGLLQQALAIRADIREVNHPSNLFPGLQSTPVRLALVVADKFAGMGVDHRAAVQEMRHAFEERPGYPRPAFVAVEMLDRWLAKTGR